MKSMKLWLLVMAPAVAAAPLFAAGTEETGAVEELEVATITALTHDLHANEAKAVMDIRKEILRDRFGIEYEWVYVPRNEVDTKLPVMFASGDFPEQLHMNWNWNVSPQRVMMLNHIPGGFFVAVDDYLDRMPNYRAQWSDEEWEFMRSLMSAGDGKMYVLPTKYPWPLDRGYMYNETEFNKLGLQFPSTTDELLEVLRAFKVEYPESVPWTHKWGWPGSATMGLRESFRTYDWGGPIYDQDAGAVVYGPATDKYRDLLKYLRTLYEEELMEKEAGTITLEQWEARIANNQSFIAGGWLSWAGFFDQLQRSQYPDAKWVVPKTEVRAYPNQPMLAYKNPAGQPFGATFTAKMDISSAKFARWIEFSEWLLTYEGTQAITAGIEGETFTWVDGVPTYRDDIKASGHPEAQHTLNDYGLGGYAGEFPEFLAMNVRHRPMLTAKEDFDHLPAVGFVYGGFTPQEIDDKVDLETVMQDTFKEHTLKFVMGQKDIDSDAEWEAYLTELKKAGLAEYERVYQAAWNRAPFF